VLAPQVQDREVTTIEGLARNKKLDVISAEIHRCAAVQCGYCTPGLILRRKIARREPAPNPRRSFWSAWRQHCRCTGYNKILRACEQAADAMGLKEEMSQPTDTLGESAARLHVTAKSSGAYETGPMKVSANRRCELDAVDKATARRSTDRICSTEVSLAKVLRPPSARGDSQASTRARRRNARRDRRAHPQGRAGTNLHGLIRRDQEVLCSKKVPVPG